MHILMEKFDVENINRQHLRPPVLAILLETIERETIERETIFHCQKIALYT